MDTLFEQLALFLILSARRDVTARAERKSEKLVTLVMFNRGNKFCFIFLQISVIHFVGFQKTNRDNNKMRSFANVELKR